jgi:hypothetical protein
MASAAQLVLDQVQSMARIAGLEAAPEGYATDLAAELAPAGAAASLAALEAQDARLRDALGQLDAMIERVMRLRLDHALALDGSLPPPTRRVFASTILRYEGQLALLEDRVRDAAARGGARDPGGVAVLACEAATATLALRDAVRAPVLAIIRDRAAAAVALADQAARDRQRDDAERQRWSAARRDLEVVAADPGCVVAAPMATRMAAWPAQLDEPAPAPEVTFADMIEMD